MFFFGFRGAGQGQSRGKYFKWGGEGLSVMEVYSAGGGGNLTFFIVRGHSQGEMSKRQNKV